MKPVDPMQEQIQAKLDQQFAEDDAGKKAASTPLPGPAAVAFAIDPNITLHGVSLRPVLDCDFEFLQFLDHPLHKMISAGLRGVEESEQFIPRGPHAWELIFLLSNDPDKIESLIADGKLKAEAKKAFSRKPMFQIMALANAAITQFNRSWEPVVGFGSPGEKKEEEANGKPNPTESSGQQSTDTGG